MLSLTCAFGLVDSVVAKETFQVRSPARFEGGGTNADRIRTDCRVESVLGNAVFGKLAQQYPGSSVLAADAPELADAKVVRLTITGIFGPGGGAYSGPKRMGVRVDIAINGKVTASATRERHSMGGVSGFFGGTCPIFDKLADVLASDIAAWIASVPGIEQPK